MVLIVTNQATEHLSVGNLVKRKYVDTRAQTRCLVNAFAFAFAFFFMAFTVAHAACVMYFSPYHATSC